MIVCNSILLVTNQVIVVDAGFAEWFIKVALAIFIPLGFWALDFLAKVLGSLPVDDVGTDLCLFALSFSATTLLVSSTSRAFRLGVNNEAIVQVLIVIALIAMVLSFLLYMFALILIKPSRARLRPLWIQRLREKPQDWKVNLTVGLGLFTLIMQITLYIIFF